MRKIEVLAIQRVSASARAMVEAVDPAVALTDAGGWFNGEQNRPHYLGGAE